MDKETQKDTRQRMQKKDNAPCNNQPKEPKERKTKKRYSSTKKIVSQKVPPKEQEAKESPKCLQKNRKQQNSLHPLNPIHSQ
jgi:hypothetical protein